MPAWGVIVHDRLALYWTLSFITAPLPS